jgi:hypothetical protein
VSTAETMVLCDYCGTSVPASQVFQPLRGGTVNRCKDAGACERRSLSAGDPTLLWDEDRPAPPPPAAPPGTACEVCRDASPAGGLYERIRGQWHCRDRAACEQRAVEVQFLHAWSDSSPDRLISSADMRAMAAAAPPEVPAARTELEPGEMAALAAADALGRKR